MGQILEYEAKTIHNAGIALGEAIGEARDKEKGIGSLTEGCQWLRSPLIDTIEKVAVNWPGWGNIPEKSADVLEKLTYRGEIMKKK